MEGGGKADQRYGKAVHRKKRFHHTGGVQPYDVNGRAFGFSLLCRQNGY